MNVLLLGPSGLIGNLTLKYLLQDERVEKLIIISRRKVEYRVASEISNAESRIVNIVGDLNKIERADFEKYHISNIDICLCALGTTLKKAKSKEEFKKVDLDLVVKMAKVSKDMGAKHFSVVSAQGASVSSPFFYSRIKAFMEAEIQKINFDSMTFIRPGLLLGDREEHRPIEKALIKLSPVLNAVLVGKFKRFRGIKAQTVAHVLAQSGFTPQKGIKVIENLELLNF